MKKYFFLAFLAFGVMTAQAQFGKILDKAKKDAKAMTGQELLVDRGWMHH